jgi:hypothetical protein
MATMHEHEGAMSIHEPDAADTEAHPSQDRTQHNQFEAFRTAIQTILSNLKGETNEKRF